MGEFVLNNGMKLPDIGYGTYQVTSGSIEIFKTAIHAGYRYFDTATFYYTERDLGAAIREFGISRDEIMIGSKLWWDQRGYDQATEAIDKALMRLGFDYFDIYMIHWPASPSDGEKWHEIDLETWRAMEDAQKAGKIKALGCSNFLPHHLKNITDNMTVKPVIDQLELHPGYMQEAAVVYCLENDIRPMAWSPLGRSRGIQNEGDGLLNKIAEKYGRSWQQIALRYLLQRGIVAIPKASTLEHMKANMDVYSFELTEEEMSLITCLPRSGWSGEHPDFYVPAAVPDPALL